MEPISSQMGFQPTTRVKVTTGYAGIPIYVNCANYEQVSQENWPKAGLLCAAVSELSAARLKLNSPSRSQIKRSENAGAEDETEPNCDWASCVLPRCHREK
jgi:hypothetical protein